MNPFTSSFRNEEGDEVEHSLPPVYFASARVKKWKYDDSLPGKLERLLRSVDLTTLLEKDEWVAVKTHFGSQGAHRIIRPLFLRKVVDAAKNLGAKPFVTDTVRIKGLDYLEVANSHGINHLSVGAPVILADGLFGHDNILVPAGDILKEISIASAIHDVTAMIVCTHVKGHINAGYAGAIKNVAMGAVSSSHRECGWKCGRGAMHTIGGGQLQWDSEICEFCEQCIEICPLEVIDFKDNEIRWDDEQCWRCGRCERGCQAGAIHFPGDDERFMKSLAEATMAVLNTFSPEKVLYLNFLTEIQPECDCMPAADVPVMQDLGVLLSTDIIAVEQASIDLIRKGQPLPSSLAEGLENDLFRGLHHKPYEIQIEEGERLGLGSREYELIAI
jgi:uncharacterized Fe-S center protein